MTQRLSCHFSIFGLVSFVLKSLLGIARQWSCEKFRILIYRSTFSLKIITLICLTFSLDDILIFLGEN